MCPAVAVTISSFTLDMAAPLISASTIREINFYFAAVNQSSARNIRDV